MTEPTGTKLPATFDDALSLLGDLENYRMLELEFSVTDADTTLSATVDTGAVSIPSYFLFADGTNEIVFCEGKSFKTLTVIRGTRGTTAVPHSPGAVLIGVLSGKHVSLMRDALIAAETFQARVGTLASRDSLPVMPTDPNVTPDPATPQDGEVWITSDAGNQRVYARVKGTWELADVLHHHELTGLNEGDPHPNLHTLARAIGWHDNLPGAHVRDGDTHDHSKSKGAGRIAGGLAGSRVAPAYAGEVYYETDTGFLQISKDTTEWVRIEGAPIGAIAMFDATATGGSGCPQGWTRYTALDGRFPIGAPAGVTTGLSNRGQDTHTHTYSQVVNHTHQISPIACTVSSVGNHTHKYCSTQSGDQVYYEYYLNWVWSGGVSDCEPLENSGSHSHTATWPAHTSSGAISAVAGSGVASSASTTATNHTPPYATVVFCQKT